MAGRHEKTCGVCGSFIRRPRVGESVVPCSRCGTEWVVPAAEPAGDQVCLRELVVTTGTASAPYSVYDRPADTRYLCLRPLPCNNPNHKSEQVSRAT